MLQLLSLLCLRSMSAGGSNQFHFTICYRVQISTLPAGPTSFVHSEEEFRHLIPPGHRCALAGSSPLVGANNTPRMQMFLPALPTDGPAMKGFNLCYGWSPERKCQPGWAECESGWLDEAMRFAGYNTAVATKPASVMRFPCHEPGFTGEILKAAAESSCGLAPLSPWTLSTASALQGLSLHEMILQKKNAEDFT